MITSSVILDIAIVGIVVICVLLGKRRGLFRTLAELVSYIVSWIASSVLATGVSVAVAEWLRPLVEEKLHTLTADIAWEMLEGGLEKLPAFLQEEKLLETVQEMLEGGMSIDMGPFIERALQNLAYMLSFIVIFIVVILVLRMLIRMMDIVTKLPVVHKLNELGGMMVGAAKSLVLVVLLLWLAKETGYLIAPEAAANSYIVPYLQEVFSL